MIDIPSSREMPGPSQIQQLLADMEWVKDYLRSLTPVETPTVHPDRQSTGTAYHAVPPTPNASSPTTGSRPTWLP